MFFVLKTSMEKDKNAQKYTFEKSNKYRFEKSNKYKIAKN